MNRSALISICISLFAMHAKAQSISDNPFVKQYATQYEQERIHIHFDKDAYLPGETVWMKAYIMAGEKPSLISKNIYFDWTDSHGNLLAHSISPITGSVSASSFAIPAGLSDGIVHVKAYTQWMLNFDSSFLFNKDIPVLAMWDGDSRTERSTDGLRFFAEGGDLVNGISSVIAFEARDQHGRPVNVRGMIKNSNNEVVDSFATVHDGMGAIRFKPADKETYMASWRDEYGELHNTPLPVARASGAVIRIQPQGDNMMHIEVERTADCPDNFKSLTIVGTMHQQVQYQSTVDLTTKTFFSSVIPTAALPTGVMQVTVLDAHLSAIAERVLFINNHQYEFAAQVKKEMVNLNRRGRNEISIEVPDSIPANFSVSVTDGGLGYDTGNNIISDLLLSGDVRGTIVDPAYYFASNSDSASRYLDLVMLTHGWRRFKWEDVAAGKLPVLRYPAEDDYMELKGQIPSSTAFDAGDSVAMLVITRDRKKHILHLPVCTDGSFLQKGMFFYDSLQVVYLLNHPAKISPNSSITLGTNLVEQPFATVSAGYPDFEWTKIPDVVLAKESDGLITEVHNYSRLSTGMSYTLSAAAKNDPVKGNFETAAHYLQNNFPDLHFPYSTKTAATGNTDDNRYVSYSISNTAPPAQKSNVNLSLDGSLVTMDDLKQISMKEVLFIKFLPKMSQKDLPTLSITSRQSLEQDNIQNNKTGLAVITGYTPEKEFYSPQYAATAEDIEASDFRSTLYWNPDVSVDKNHKKIRLAFYNNDLTNKFRVVVEGMNADGKLIRMEEIIK